MNWEEQPQEVSKDITYDSQPTDFNDIDSSNWERHYSFLGKLPKVPIDILLFKLDYNNENITNEIVNSGFEPVDKDNRYKIHYQGNSELTKVLNSIKNIGDLRGFDLHHSYLYKNSPNESVLNIAKGQCIYNYIYFTQAEYNSGDVILDFSALNGPSEKILENSPGILALIPGWVPYRISKNSSTKDMIAIGGRFTFPSS